MKILYIEDDQDLVELIQLFLAEYHYQVDVATDGQMGWYLVNTYPYDVILLNLILPMLNGVNFCQRLRDSHSNTINRDTPILIMTELEQRQNKVIGLNAGADDCLVKPFEFEELLAIIRALLRRNKEMHSPLLTWGALSLNPNNCKVTYYDQPIMLTSKEYQILELFLRNPNFIFSSSRLLNKLYQFEQFPSEGTIRSHIKSIRKKLKQAGLGDILETIYKLGYRLKEPETWESK